MKLYHTKLMPVAFSATTEQTGYQANNLGNDSVALPWRGADLAATDLVLTLGGVASIAALELHDVNFASATIEKSVDGIAWVGVGTMSTYADNYGRRRGSIAIAAAGQLAVRARIPAGAALDGLAYWRAGAAHLFGGQATVGALPEYGYRVRTRLPQVATPLRNGRVPTARTGANIDRIDLTFGNRLPTEQLDEFITRVTAGTCLLDMELPDYPAQQWPVRCIEEEIEEAFVGKKISSTNVPLIEVA